ncbi:hypothetical protein LCGC14_1396740 [marine sediment metagenome]|uniref:Uncharacterized protein n=1 Tax=marine sediment metagenome TaxID=412755 RepID=A0A0F9MDX3_9ZZZZ
MNVTNALHPSALNITCALRRIHKHKIWYLYSMDAESGKVVWTQQFIKAHLFKNCEEAMDFARIFLGAERLKECDTFSEYETWSI